MRSTTFFAILTVCASSALLAACGSDTGTASTGTGGATSGTAATTSAGGGSATSSGEGGGATTSGSTTSGASSSGASGTGGGPALVNGCDPTALVDHTTDATVEIKFGDAVGFKYAPPCIKVKSGTMVTFTGSTLVHPLAPGEVVNGVPVPDPKSPIKATSAAAPSVAFAITPAGSYPYFCTDHYAGGMQGLIVAE